MVDRNFDMHYAEEFFLIFKAISKNRLSLKQFCRRMDGGRFLSELAGRSDVQVS